MVGVSYPDWYKVDTIYLATKGWVTVGAYQLVNGIPVARSEAGKDALCPLTSSCTPALIN
jgi:hypothetical protein